MKPLLVLDVKKLTEREKEDLRAAGFDVPVLITIPRGVGVPSVPDLWRW